VLFSVISNKKIIGKLATAIHIISSTRKISEAVSKIYFCKNLKISTLAE
jgi:hypothetical protein